jgi:hypothetical protein
MKRTPLKALTVSVVAALLISFFAACGGPSGVRVIQGEDPVSASATGGRAIQAGDATIVHVNERERLATMRNGTAFPASTFLKTVDRDGNETGFLKTRAKRPSGLRTADILEGNPDINNRAVAVNDAERARLETIYRDPVDDSN